MSAQDRGWGTGWPNCQASSMVKVALSRQQTIMVAAVAQHAIGFGWRMGGTMPGTR